ncbi:MAG TPA: glycosyl hydrolase family 28 protein [Chthoniobacteraceae bacterium]|nr:glycosyl hydrolase family 28 protein [Chthoniobacteraceae bacterium]
MSATSCFNVRTHGAVGNGITSDQRAIQAAIDACAAAGGGTVVVPTGRYLTGTLWLKSHVELHLGPGATLVASSAREAYNADDVFPENVVFSREQVTGAHLVIAYRQENVSLTGPGCIDGSSSSFFGELPDGTIATYRYKSGNYPIRSWRPGQMIFFCQCREVRVRDLSLLNAPYWTLFLLGCDDVQVRSVRITNPPATANGDGIDIDCCRNVTVSDCIIRSGDDSITIRASGRRLGKEAQACENVTVSNSVLSSPCNAIRVGVGNGVIRRITFNNIVVDETRTAISIVSRYSPHGASGVAIRQVAFSNFIIDAIIPISMNSGCDPMPPAEVSDISFSHFKVVASAASQWVGTAEVPLRRITFQDVHLTLRGGTDNTAFQEIVPTPLRHIGYHGRNGAPALPCALHITHLEEGVIDGLRIDWEEISPVWQYGLWLEHCGEVHLSRALLRQPQSSGGAAIACRHVTGLRLSGCIARPETDLFLQLDAASSLSGDFAGNNQLEAAATACAMAEKEPAWT